MKNRKLLALLAIPLAGLGIVGSAVLAANKAEPTVANTSVGAQQNVQDRQDSKLPEAEESQQLLAKAKITADQAKKIAEAKVGGTATDATLGDEDGTVVYEVTISGQDVKVNALDGSILRVEKSDGEKNDDHLSKDKETNDNGGRADLETNDG